MGMVFVDMFLMWCIVIFVVVFLNEMFWYILVVWLFLLVLVCKVYFGLKIIIDCIFSGFLVLFGLKIVFD